MSDPRRPAQGWRVQRRLARRRRRVRWRGPDSGWLDLADCASSVGELPVIGVVLAPLAVLLTAVVALAVLPFVLVIAVEAFVVAVLTAGTVALVRLRGRWLVEASDPYGSRWSWSVRGRPAADEVVDALEAFLALGGRPEEFRHRLLDTAPADGTAARRHP